MDDRKSQSNDEQAARSSSRIGTWLRTLVGEEPDQRPISPDLLGDERALIDAARHAKELAATTNVGPQGVSDCIGLAFSGGGIRSATFNLGVLQSLARRKMLRHVDYLSTVSGGGYIGSWLVAWLKRLAEPDDPAMGFQKGAARALDELEQALADRQSPEPVRHLRRYSNYLTPYNSFFSADTWSLVAIWTRNLLLNLAIIVCIIAAAMIVPRLAGLQTVRRAAHAASSPLLGPEPIVAFILLLWCAVWISRYLYLVSGRTMDMAEKTVGRIPKNPKRASNSNQAAIQAIIVAPLLLAAAAASLWISRLPWEALKRDALHLWPVPAFMAICFAIITIVGGFAAGFAHRHARSGGTSWSLRFLGALLALPISAASAGATTAVLYGLVWVIGQAPEPWRPWAVTVFGPPAVLITLAIGVVCLVGLMGQELPDPSREWLGRLRAWSSVYALIWIAIFSASIYGPWLLYKGGAWVASTAGGAWLLTTIGGLIAGRSAGTSGKDSTESSGLKTRGAEMLALAAPYVFMAGMFIAIAWGVHVFAAPDVQHRLKHPNELTVTLAGRPDNVAMTLRDAGRSGVPYTTFETRVHDYVWNLANIDPPDVGGNANATGSSTLPALLAIALVVGFVLAWRVDVNEFSMHHFYKNRLVRAYLGASRNHRCPDRFTEFDPGDDFPLASLSHAGRDDVSKDDFASKVYCGPYPIINGALNLSGADSLAWQERRAASYIFTPLYSGYEKNLVDRETGGTAEAAGCQPQDQPLDPYAYRPTHQCGNSNGIQIGAAMAISGAAANPNCGYHTSTAVAFFLSVLNVRLGWWLGNPAHPDYYRKPSPRLGLPYLMVELFGLADKNRGYVNVSDGGHFENLGIYELVRRRCKYIIACDAEEDGQFAFGGLAGAIRKCSADFGVEIRIDLDSLRLNDRRLSAAHCAVGTIDYGPKERKGTLVYLKSSMTGDEESDIIEYRSRACAFPHQSTGDQWFDESQFESYRRLGFHVAESAWGDVRQIDKAARSYVEEKDRFFAEVQMMHYPPSKSVRQSFTRHTDRLARVFESLGASEQLAKYDRSILGKWRQQGGEFAKEHDRRAFYWCNSLLQLMEDVYVDLDLHHRVEREHPENAGWMRLFEGWSVTPLFRSTWEMAGESYGSRFQRFFEELQTRQTARVIGEWKASKNVWGVGRIEFRATPDRDLRGDIDFNSERLTLSGIDFNGAGVEFQCGRPDGVWTFELRFLDEEGGENHFRDAVLTFGRSGESDCNNLEMKWAESQA